MSVLADLLSKITTFKGQYSNVFKWLQEATLEIDDLRARVSTLESRPAVHVYDPIIPPIEVE